MIERLQHEINKALASKEGQQYLEPEGGEAVGSTPAEFAAFLKKEDAKWGEVVRKGHIKLD